MGKRLTASEETALLQATVRAAHEATQELRAAIREANQLAPTLVSHFEELHRTEMQQLSNHFAEESNLVAATLNADVHRAREMIFNQIMSGKAVFDADTRTVTISFGEVGFDDHQPLPYPNTPPKEDDQ